MIQIQCGINSDAHFLSIPTRLATPAVTGVNDPSTGDSSNVWLWIVLIGASILGFAEIALSGKKKLFGGKRKV